MYEADNAHWLAQDQQETRISEVCGSAGHAAGHATGYAFLTVLFNKPGDDEFPTR